MTGKSETVGVFNPIDSCWEKLNATILRDIELWVKKL
jgi:hypothetical protein